MSTPKPKPEPAQTSSEYQKFYDGTINQIADSVHFNAIAHGFHPPEQHVDDWLAHMCCNKHAEISELYDAWRAGTLHLPCDKAEKMKAMHLPELTCAEEEYADLIIRCLDECRRLKIDIARAIAVKHMFNITRPYKHGKKS